MKNEGQEIQKKKKKKKKKKKALFHNNYSIAIIWPSHSHEKYSVNRTCTCGSQPEKGARPRTMAA